jgi:hypothetical protein
MIFPEKLGNCIPTGKMTPASCKNACDLRAQRKEDELNEDEGYWVEGLGDADDITWVCNGTGYCN